MSQSHLGFPHSLFNRFRDFLPEIVSLQARELFDVLVENFLLGESDVSLLTDEPELELLFLVSSRSAAAISGNMSSVLEDFLEELGSLDADLHRHPLGC